MPQCGDHGHTSFRSSPESLSALGRYFEDYSNGGLEAAFQGSVPTGTLDLAEILRNTIYGSIFYQGRVGGGIKPAASEAPTNQSASGSFQLDYQVGP